MNLSKLGWNEYFEDEFARTDAGNDLIPARVAREDRNKYDVITVEGSFSAIVSGAFTYNALSHADFPTVGDWVVVNTLPDEGKAIIHRVLPRQSVFSRKSAGIKTERQIIAANINTVFHTLGLNRDFNLRKIERYITQIRLSGAQPVILLNKADLCDDPLSHLTAVNDIAPDVPAYYLSAAVDENMDCVRRHIRDGETATFTGSSGVGKSTIINRLIGSERLLTREINEEFGKGLHTTTWRELIVLPEGGIVIDTPGMRELQLWSDPDDQPGGFDDVENLFSQCRFRNCRHEYDPGCAVLQALKNGELDGGRYKNYLKMKREAMFLDKRRREKAILEKSAKMKQIAIFSRKRNKVKY
ncbi:MAG: ribosome small subunit-dependent GTPase A [Calditrichaeota bacterium]|nr:ribosome small subunit-dependent GTPase A [Calditrichota bacterium]